MNGIFFLVSYKIEKSWAWNVCAKICPNRIQKKWFNIRKVKCIFIHLWIESKVAYPSKSVIVQYSTHTHTHQKCNYNVIVIFSIVILNIYSVRANSKCAVCIQCNENRFCCFVSSFLYNSPHFRWCTVSRHATMTNRWYLVFYIRAIRCTLNSRM